MKKNILQYQKAFNSIINKLNSEKSVLAVITFGSMVTGDLWDESDIDLLVILENKFIDIKNIYSEEKSIPIHMKLISKDTFIKLYRKDLNRGSIYDIFTSSKLVFCKDKEITISYENGRYYLDKNREIWSMVYLGKLIKHIGICKKYLSKDRIYIAYTSVIKCIEEFSKIYVNSCGYMISKDSMTVAINLNDEFKKYVDLLFLGKENICVRIKQVIEYLENSIDKSIINNTKMLINYLREQEGFKSTEDIKNDDMFVDFDLDIKEVLNKLCEKNIIKKKMKNCNIGVGSDNILFKEWVYSI